MTKEIEILDPNWIAAVLSISFTLVVFLLGLPMIFIQTFVPEELRSYYNSIQKAEMKKANLPIILLLLIILIFGNHGFKYIVSDVFPACLFGLNKNGQMAFFYFLSLAIFISLSWRVFAIFKKSVFRNENIKRQIIEKVFFETDLAFDNSTTTGRNKYLPDESFQEIVELSELINHSVDRTFFYKQLFGLILKIVAEEHYNGEGTKMFFEKILYVDFVKGPDFPNYIALNTILDICNEIGIKYKSSVNFKSFDSEYITEIFLFELCIKFMRTENINLARKSVNILQTFNAQQSVYFKIYFTAYEHKLYSLVVEEIKKITQRVYKNEIVETDQRAFLNNLIAYVSFFHSGNTEMKIFAKKAAKRIGMFLDVKSCLIAKKDFLADSKFETADKIRMFTDDYFIPRNKLVN